jgi:rod shape-determining protein MreD
MSPHQRRQRLAIGLSAVAALLFAVYPLPAGFLHARPEWLSLLVVYWVLRAPLEVGMGSAWLLGLLFDGLTGGPLGAHALALCVVAYVVLALRARILHWSLVQQVLLVGGCAALGQFLCHWVQGLAGHPAPDASFLLASLTTAACWPIVGVQFGPGGRAGAWDAAS